MLQKLAIYIFSTLLSIHVYADLSESVKFPNIEPKKSDKLNLTIGDLKNQLKDIYSDYFDRYNQEFKKMNQVSFNVISDKYKESVLEKISGGTEEYIKDKKSYEEINQATGDEIKKNVENELKIIVESKKIKPEIDSSRIVFGNASAKITVVIYSDFECPYCAQAYQEHKKVAVAHPNDVRIIYKHFPLSFHKLAMPAAKYYEAVAKQSHAFAEKYMEDIFNNHSKFRSDGVDFLKASAKKIGVNMEQLETDINNYSVTKVISDDMDEAKKFKINGTPSLIVDGEHINWDGLDSYVGKLLEKK